MARYDGDPKSGGFRAPVGAAVLAADLEQAVRRWDRLDGRVVKGAGTSGVVGVLINTAVKAVVGDIVDVTTDGEIVEAARSRTGPRHRGRSSRRRSRSGVCSPVGHPPTGVSATTVEGAVHRSFGSFAAARLAAERRRSCSYSEARRREFYRPAAPKIILPGFAFREASTKALEPNDFRGWGSSRAIAGGSRGVTTPKATCSPTTWTAGTSHALGRTPAIPARLERPPSAHQLWTFTVTRGRGGRSPVPTVDFEEASEFGEPGGSGSLVLLPGVRLPLVRHLVTHN